MSFKTPSSKLIRVSACAVFMIVMAALIAFFIRFTARFHVVWYMMVLLIAVYAALCYCAVFVLVYMLKESKRK